MAASFEERLDELLGMAAHAAMLGTEAVHAAERAYATRDSRLTRRARESRKRATAAEQILASARSRFLAGATYTITLRGNVPPSGESPVLCDRCARGHERKLYAPCGDATCECQCQRTAVARRG